MLFIIAIFSQTFDVGVLYPPLAATCFINATCVYLRVARPKSVIVGHFIASVGGLLGVIIGDALFTGSDLLVPVKLGLGVMFAAIFMQILDADHPPAAATAAIPALFETAVKAPCDNLVLPLHMAYGAVIAVVFAIFWNRMWFEWPIDDQFPERPWFNLNMEKPDILGTAICIIGFILMCLKPWSDLGYLAGLIVMFAGVSVLSVHHFFTATLAKPITPP